MGGFGSGRSGWKRKAEHCRTLDVNVMRRHGCLEAGYRGGWGWTRGGEQVASIGFHSRKEAVTLSYRIQEHGGTWQDIEERVPLVWASCRYGGARPWFRCPGVVNGRACGRRVGKLFLRGRYFLCRHCHRIAYASQSETPLDRLYRRRDKTRAALGAEPGCFGTIPPRPKGMWRRTYERKRDAIWAADMDADEAFAVEAEKLLSRMRR